MEIEKAHAKFSASGSERWLNCPGSIQLSENAPKMPDSPYALEGTQAHSCLEIFLKNRDNFKKAWALAEEYSDEMKSHALDAARWVVMRLAERPGATFLCESKIDSSSFTCKGQFGTLDAAIVDRFDRLIVIDYKYGAGVAVDPEGYSGRGNSQLVYYALGVSEEYQHEFFEVELVVIQPRAFHASGNTIRSVTLPMEDLLAWKRKFKKGVKACQAPDAPLNKGAWCLFCPAILICPLFQKSAIKEGEIKIEGKSLFLPDLKKLSGQKLSTMLQAAEQLDLWAKRLKEYAFHHLKSGQEIPGYKLVEKRAYRKWLPTAEKDARAFWGDLAFSEPQLRSPSELERALRSIDVDKRSAEKWVEERTSKESSGLTLTKDKDQRIAKQIIPENIFPEIINVTPRKGKT